LGAIGRTVGRVWSWFKCRVPSDLGRVWYHLPTERLTTPRCARGGAGRSFDGRERKIMFGSPTNSISWLSPLSSSSSRGGALVARRESERVATARARPTTARRVEWTARAPARAAGAAAPTCAEHGRLQRILRSLGLGRVWFCVVFSKLNTSR